jgi:hypothetical protein
MAGIEKKIRIGILVGKSQDWTDATLILRVGEVGYESDTHRSKMGDGTSPWNILPYTGSLTSQPPEGHYPVTNIFVNAETGKLEVEYEIPGG